MKSTTLFQLKVYEWVLDTFGIEVARDLNERSFKFIEESLELVQANGISKEDVLKLVDYVYSRPAGILPEEIGDVMITLSALASCEGEDIIECGIAILQRNIINKDRIREKHLSKQSGSPLPGISDIPKDSFNKLAETIKESLKQL